MNMAINPKLDAGRDLLTRYVRVFRHAWGERKLLYGPPVHETEFLPATLAIRETPVHPAPRVAMGAIMLFAAIALAWAIFGKIDIVASARGKLIPDDRSKIIQSMETASVQAIHVRDGQLVEAGSLLIELDDTQVQADATRIGQDSLSARLEAARARAMLIALETGRDPSLIAVGDADAARLAAERRLLEGRYGELAARLSQLDAEIERRKAEMRAIRELAEKLAQTLPIVRQRAMDYNDLQDRNFVSRHGYLEKEQARIEQERDLAAQRAKLEEIQAALLEGRRQRAALLAETRRATLDTLNQAEQKIADLAQERVKADNRGRLRRLVAPVAGTVQQLAVHTVGGVVTTASPLLVIVPHDNPLEVEAFVENRDIGFVQVGQAAEVKLDAFPFTRYGMIRGRVMHLSHDAIQDEKLGLIYAARVRLDQATLDIGGKTVNLSPGMAVTVEIKTGKRRVVEYFLSPLIQYADESLRER